MRLTKTSGVVLVAILGALSSSSQAEMPQRVRDVLNAHWTGQWNWTETYDGNTRRGWVYGKWEPGGMSLINTSVSLGEEQPIHIRALAYWQEETQEVVEHGSASNGEYYTIRWTDTSSSQQWKGRGSGWYNGKRWESETKLEFKENERTYSDTTEGKPFVITFNRPEFEAQEAFEAFASYMAKGKWITTRDDGVTVVDQHVWDTDKKFVRIESLVGANAVTSTYGVDPETGLLTLRIFLKSGEVGEWRLVACDGENWTWEGKPSKEGHTATAVLSMIDENTSKVRITASNGAAEGQQMEFQWKRQVD